MFLATFPTTMLFLVVLIFQVRITSGPMNAYIFACQLMVSAIDFQSSICKSTSSFNHVAVLIVGTTYGIWNLDFFRYLIPSFCASEQLSTLHVVTLDYVVAFYPLFLTIIAYICIQLYARDCKVIVCGRFFVTISTVVMGSCSFSCSYIHCIFTAFIFQDPVCVTSATELHTAVCSNWRNTFSTHEGLACTTHHLNGLVIPIALLAIFVLCVFIIILNSCTCSVIASNQSIS